MNENDYHNQFIKERKAYYLNECTEEYLREAISEEKLGEHYGAIMASAIRMMEKSKTEDALQLFRLIGEQVYKRVSSYAEECAKIDRLSPMYDHWLARRVEQEKEAKRTGTPLSLVK